MVDQLSDGERFLRGLSDLHLGLLLQGIDERCAGFDAGERQIIHTLLSMEDVRKEVARRLIAAGAATGRRVR